MVVLYLFFCFLRCMWMPVVNATRSSPSLSLVNARNSDLSFGGLRAKKSRTRLRSDSSRGAHRRRLSPRVPRQSQGDTESSVRHLSEYRNCANGWVRLQQSARRPASAAMDRIRAGPCCRVARLVRGGFAERAISDCRFGAPGNGIGHAALRVE